MKRKSLKATKEMLEEMSLLRTLVERVQPIIRSQSEKLKKIESVKLMNTPCQTQANDVLCNPDRKRRFSSEAEDFISYLQKDVNLRQEMMTLLLPVLRCIQRLRTLSHHNPFLSQQSFDLILEAVQQLKRKYGGSKQAKVDEHVVQT